MGLALFDWAEPMAVSCLALVQSLLSLIQRQISLLTASG